MVPQGRLSLQPDSDVWTAEVATSDAIYYVPSGDSIVLNPAVHKAGQIFDVFMKLTGELTSVLWPTATSTPAARGLSRDWAGLWSNNEGLTYLGSFYVHADGLATVMLQPPPVYGGCNTIVGLYNAYNRQRVTVWNVDKGPPGGMWINQSASVQYFDQPGPGRGQNNKISWLDGLGTVNADLVGQVTVSGASSSAGAVTVGVGYDRFEMYEAGRVILNQAAFVSANEGMTIPVRARQAGRVGLHYFALMMKGTSVPVNIYGNGFSGMVLEIDV